MTEGNSSRSAAELGEPLAQSTPGLKYQYGDGVQKNLLTALMWFNVAAGVFPPPDTNTADIISIQSKLVAKELTAAQILEAKQLAEQWLSANRKK